MKVERNGSPPQRVVFPIKDIELDGSATVYVKTVLSRTGKAAERTEGAMMMIQCIRTNLMEDRRGIGLAEKGGKS